MEGGQEGRAPVQGWQMDMTLVCPLCQQPFQCSALTSVGSADFPLGGGAGPASHVLCLHAGLNFQKPKTPLCLEKTRRQNWPGAASMLCPLPCQPVGSLGDGKRQNTSPILAQVV